MVLVNYLAAQPNLAAATDASHSALNVFWRSVVLVSIAELFDKTWFMGLVLALRYPAGVVFAGSFTALFLHCILAAAFGLAFAKLLSAKLLSFFAAVLFFFFGLVCLKDWYDADPESDAIESGRQEADEDVGEIVENVENPSESTKIDASDNIAKEYGTISNEEAETDATAKAAASVKVKMSPWQENFQIFVKAFVAVFIAEWGDQTQIAMIGQHASNPLIPVFWGSVVAFFLLTASAVGLAKMASGLKISERLVKATCAACFLGFGAWALHDGISLTIAEKHHHWTHTS